MIIKFRLKQEWCQRQINVIILLTYKVFRVYLFNSICLLPRITVSF
jgi:hypothetical protein